MANTAAPSGRLFNDEERNLLRQMAVHRMLVWSDVPIPLSNGAESQIYVYGREDVTDNLDFAELCGQYIGRRLSVHLGQDKRQPILIGIPTAGTGLAASMGHYVPRAFGSRRAGYRVMREVQKMDHGSPDQRGYWVNGRPDVTKHAYATIDNAVESGKSLHLALTRLSDDGYPVKDMPHLVFIDRERGGVEKLKEQGYKILPLFKLLDVVWAFRELGIKGWDSARLLAVETEIRRHQTR